MQRSWPSLIGWLALTFAAAAIGTWASLGADVFYGQLVRPTWAPPAWLFGPVWTLLYALMAVAAWIVWPHRSTAGARRGLVLYGVQLALNALWSVLFFGLHRGLLSVMDIAALWILIVLTMLEFWRVRPVAGALLVPYLLWVSFAAALDITLWRLNPGLL